MSITTTIDPKVLFERWFAAAIAVLEKYLDNGDGGMAGMMIVLPLYERYIQITRASTKPKADFFDVIAKDLQLNRSEAETFWATFRNGFCHTGMPLNAANGKKLPQVQFSEDHTWQPKLQSTTQGQLVICLDPWKFIRHVMDKYRKDATLLEQQASAPLLPIHVITA